MSHPGEILARHLQELGLTASDLARDIDVPVNRVTAILNGQRGVTADTALRLGHWFGVQPEDWLELQTQYELSLARRAAGARIKSLPSLADRQRD
ncbi:MULTISPECIES: HigA family addiction module antitoxin [unclassified Methylocystis]|nr:HigA family addiction module antitoxin [Methylocystis sp. H4A]